MGAPDDLESPEFLQHLFQRESGSLLEELESTEPSLETPCILRCIQPFIDQLLLRLLVGTSYSSFHPYILVNKGVRGVLNPITEDDHYRQGPLSCACDCVGAALILRRLLFMALDKHPSRRNFRVCASVADLSRQKCQSEHPTYANARGEEQERNKTRTPGARMSHNQHWANLVNPGLWQNPYIPPPRPQPRR